MGTMMSGSVILPALGVLLYRAFTLIFYIFPREPDL